jgi:hypothetical protein
LGPRSDDVSGTEGRRNAPAGFFVGWIFFKTACFDDQTRWPHRQIPPGGLP